MFNVKNKEKDSNSFVLLNWNVRNPSHTRAVKQIETLLDYSPDIIVLTEIKDTKGWKYMRDRLFSGGYDSFFTAPKDDYGVIVAAPVGDFEADDIQMDFLPHRAILIKGNSIFGRMRILGVYVPSRGPKERRNADKMKFQSELAKALHRLAGREGYCIVAGDLNVLERDHRPHYTVFGEWEYRFYESFLQNGLVDAYRVIFPHTQDYSWFGREGDGYRFDHMFISQSLQRYLKECKYIHEPRIQILSDHSVICMKLYN
jgi:exodeoxyribonuclease III